MLSIQDTLTEVYVSVDDFCNEFDEVLKKSLLKCSPLGKKTCDRSASLFQARVITSLITFHGGQFRNFKHL